MTQKELFEERCADLGIDPTRITGKNIEKWFPLNDEDYRKFNEETDWDAICQEQGGTQSLG